MEKLTNYSWGYAAGMIVIFGVWILLGMILGVIGILYMILSEHIKDKMKDNYDIKSIVFTVNNKEIYKTT